MIDKLLLKGKEKFEELEAFQIQSKEIEIAIFNGEVDKYSISESGGLSLRGIVDGKMGYSYTEKLDESSITMLINEAYENGKYIDDLDGDKIFSGSSDYKVIEKKYDKLSLIPMEDKIEFAKNIEKEALALDKKITSVQMCGYQEFEQETKLINSKGVNLYDKGTGALAYISVVAKDNDDVKTGLAFRVFNDLNTVDYKEIAKEAVEEALSMLGATSMKSGDYPVIIKNIVFADIIQAFSSIFSADSVQKGLSLLKDKIGEEIANPILTIVDNPYLKDGFASKYFDDEGTSTKDKKVIDNGILTTYLHSWKTSKKDGVESTGNASRSSYKSTLSISPSNFYVEKGDKSFEDLISGIEKGVYIINVAGLHSGLNPVSGDFSLSAHGFEILNGKINRPVNQITIAGNFYEVLKNIDAIGNDLKFGFPGDSYFGSPSVRIDKISVSGE